MESGTPSAHSAQHRPTVKPPCALGRNECMCVYLCVLRCISWRDILECGDRHLISLCTHCIVAIRAAHHARRANTLQALATWSVPTAYKTHQPRIGIQSAQYVQRIRMTLKKGAHCSSTTRDALTVLRANTAQGRERMNVMIV